MEWPTTINYSNPLTSQSYSVVILIYYRQIDRIGNVLKEREVKAAKYELNNFS